MRTLCRKGRDRLVLVSSRAGPGLLAEGFGGRGARRGGGWDREDVGDHSSELKLLLWRRLRGIARARVWSQRVAGRALRRRRLLLGLSSGLRRRLPDNNDEVVVVIGGRRRQGQGRGSLGLSAPVEEVVNVEVGGEGEPPFGVQPMEP